MFLYNCAIIIIEYSSDIKQNNDKMITKYGLQEKEYS